MEKLAILGMRFHPTQEEKIGYLLVKVNGKTLPCENLTSIPTVEIYGDKEPSEIFEDSKDNEFHFFTQTINNDDQAVYIRRVGWNGKWKIHQQKTGIRDSRNQEIGFVNKFKYKKWILEYTLTDKFKGCIKHEYADYAFYSPMRNPDSDSEDHQENKNPDVQNILDQILLASSSSSNDPPQTPLDVELKL